MSDRGTKENLGEHPRRPVPVPDYTGEGVSPEARLSQSERRALLVIGMHRSGTSAATRVLGLLGARLPSQLIPGDEFNEPGYWEPEGLVHLHDEMLESAGYRGEYLVGADTTETP